MKASITRREFARTGALAGLSVALPGRALAWAPAIRTGSRVRPVVVASHNGHRYTNGGDRTCVEEVFARMTAGDDVLDAVIAGVTLNELDPDDVTVGFGGRPNGDGVVQLDASCMHGPTRRAGAVAALEGVRTPSHVARAVMNNTSYHLLVGDGAQRFARQLGFTIEDDLTTERSRELWLEWKRRIDPTQWLDPETRAAAGHEAGLKMLADGLVDVENYYGTINCNAVNAAGELAGCTTTSGMSWKIPGRVGDSPIIGAGLYVDGDVGAAGSTGHGESNLFNLTSYQIVENLRRGMHPTDAGMDGLRRVQRNTVEQRLLNSRGLPGFYLRFYIVNAQGEFAGVSMYEGNFSVCTENGPELLPCEVLLEGTHED